MLFNSLTFVVFFAVVLALYRLLPTWPAKKVLLLVASYVFYGAWNPPFILLLLFSTFAWRPGPSEIPCSCSASSRSGCRS